MRKLLIILFLLAGVKSFAQYSPPVSPTQVSQMTWYKDLGGRMWVYRGSTLGWFQMADSLEVSRMITRSVGGGYLPKANNGLTVASDSTIQLGGTLIQDSQITGNEHYFYVTNNTPGSTEGETFSRMLLLNNETGINTPGAYLSTNYYDGSDISSTGSLLSYTTGAKLYFAYTYSGSNPSIPSGPRHQSITVGNDISGPATLLSNKITIEDGVNHRGAEYPVHYNFAQSPQQIPDRQYVDSVATAGSGSFVHRTGSVDESVDGDKTFTGHTILNSAGTVLNAANVNHSSELSIDDNFASLANGNTNGSTDGFYGALYLDHNQTDLQHVKIAGGISYPSDIIIDSTQMVIRDRINNRGLTYYEDYSTNGKLYNRWIPDWEAVKNRVDSATTAIGSGFVPYSGATNNVNIGAYNLTSAGQFVYPTSGQPLTTYKNSIYTAKSFVGMQGSPEFNASFNMDYNQPGKVGVHQYSDPTLGAIWYAAGGTRGWCMQYAPANVAQTGVGTLTFTGGSGYTDGSYSLPATGGTGTGEVLNLTISGGVVTACTSSHIGDAYTVGDVLSVSGIGAGTGFSATVTSLFADIWYKSGQNMFLRGDVITGTLTLSATGASTPVVGAGVQVERYLGRASMSGTTASNGFVLNGHPTAGTAAPIYLNSDNTGTTFISGGGGAAQFGSINTIAANVRYNFLGTQSATTSASGLKFGVGLTPTANGQIITEAQFTPTFNAGTGALTATITTAATSLADGTYDNLTSTATSGSGSGQTWKVTVSGGNVTTIIPATSATGGTGYAVGNTFTVNTVTGAVFTVATLGYTGSILTSAQFNGAPIQLATLGNPTNPATGMLYSTGTSLRFYNGAITLVGLQTTAGANTQVPIFNSSGLLVPTTPTGTGAPVLQTSPTFVTPNIGTPSAGVLTNATGLPTAGLVNNAVTYAKMQAMTANRLLGSGASGTAVAEMTLGTNLSFTGTTLNAAGFANPMTTLGDVIYGGASGVATRLAGNTTTTPKVLFQTGNGTNSAAPVWTDPYASPALTGVPTAPTASLGTNTTQLATMAALFDSDALTVHKAGTETITGVKTFTFGFKIASNNPVTFLGSNSTNFVNLVSADPGSTDYSQTLQAKNGTVADLEDLPISQSYIGVGVPTTTFTVTIGLTMANTSYKVNATPTNALAASAPFYISNKTTTTFDIVYTSPITGTINLDWAVFP